MLLVSSLWLLKSVCILVERNSRNLFLSASFHVDVVLVDKFLQLVAASLFVSVLKVFVSVFRDYWLLNRGG